jgi:hypothetical protein
MWRNHAVVGFSLMLLVYLSPPAAAQQATSFAELGSRLRPGDKVILTDSLGTISKGTISDISPSSVRMEVKGTKVEWRDNDVRRLDKGRRDPWWDWALIGGGIGAVSGYAVAQVSNNSSYSGIWAPWGAGIGAATGAVIDLSRRKFDTVFQGPTRSTDNRIRFAPVLRKDSKGAALSFSF